MAEPSSSRAHRGEQMELSQLLERLHLENDELDNVVWEDEVDESEEKPKWLALA